MAEEIETQVDDQATPADQTPPVEPPPTPPVEQLPQPPQTTLGEVTPRQQVEVVDLDTRFAQARRVIESDEMLTTSERELKLLDLDLKHADYRDRSQQNAESAEDRARNSYAKRYGATREIVDSTWNDATAESIRRRGKFDHGTALTVFENKMDALKKPAEVPPIVEKLPTGQTRIQPRGARQAPVQADKKMTVQEILHRAAMGDHSAIPADVLEEAKR